MKVPEPKKLPSGSYNIRMRLGGEEISITRTSPSACKQEAQIIKAEYLAGKRIQRVGGAGEQTLKTVIRSYIDKNKATLSPATVRSYEAYLRARFPDYMDLSLQDIDWQELINKELQKVSPKTVRNGWALVTVALRAAGYPVPEVRLAACPVNEIAFLQPDEILKFCKALKGKPYEIPALLLLHGLRLSELQALTWDNIDLKQKQIKIKGATVRGPDGKITKQTNKNKSSTRTVPILIPQLEKALKAVPEKDRTGLVDRHGQQTLLDDVKRACRQAGVTETTCHGLRHSFSSMLYRTPGVTERHVMQWGGWANIQTMHKVYIRIAAQDEKAAADAVRKFYQGKRENQNADENADGVQNSP